MHSTFCRITGHARNLPKPNYFPLLPPISPADAKKICRITGRSPKEAHCYIPIIEFGKSYGQNSCKITKKSRGNKRHHYREASQRTDKSIGCRVTEKKESFGEYRYVFPQIDDSKKGGDGGGLQRVIERFRSEISPEDKGKNFVYSVQSESLEAINIVLPPEIEHAIRVGEIEGVMLSKMGDKLKVQMKEGKMEEIVIRKAADSEMNALKDILYDGMGQDPEVLKRQKKIMENKKRPRKCGLSDRKDLFEEKEKIEEEKEKKSRIIQKVSKTNEKGDIGIKKIKTESKRELKTMDPSMKGNDCFGNGHPSPIDTVSAVNSMSAHVITVNNVSRDAPPTNNASAHDSTTNNASAHDSTTNNASAHDSTTNNASAHDSTINSISGNAPTINNVTGQDPTIESVTRGTLNVKSLSLDNPVVLTMDKIPPQVDAVWQSSLLDALEEARRQTENLVPFGLNWRDIYAADREGGWNWEDIEKICDASARQYEDILSNNNVDMSKYLVSEADGLAISPEFRVTDTNPITVTPATSVAIGTVNGDKSRLEAAHNSELIIMNSAEFAGLVPTVSNMSYAICGMDSDNSIVGHVTQVEGKLEFYPYVNTDGNVDSVCGQMVQVDENKIFIPGQPVNTSQGTTFIAGRVVTTRNGLQFLPGQTITDNQGNLMFIPGHVTDSAGEKSFNPGVIDPDTGMFVAGQFVDTKDGKVFLRGRTVTNNGESRFLPGIESGDKLIPGQVRQGEGGEVFTPGMSYLDGSGQTKFIPGQSIKVEGQQTFIPGILQNSDSGNLHFTPGFIVDTQGDTVFHEGHLVERDGEMTCVLKSKGEDAKAKGKLSLNFTSLGGWSGPSSPATPQKLENFNPKLLPECGWELEEGEFGYMVREGDTVRFQKDTELRDISEDQKVLPGLKTNKDGESKFIPGKMISTKQGTKFVPGQVVQTSKGNQFIPGRVIKTGLETKFVPGQVIETPDGPQFVLGQVIETGNGPKFVPGQIINTKSGPTFVPGQVVETDEGTKFMPGQLVETADGPKFLPGQLIESEGGAKFIPGRAVDTDEGLRYLPTDLEQYEDGSDFSLQSFNMAAEEIDFIHSMSSLDMSLSQLRRAVIDGITMEGLEMSDVSIHDNDTNSDAKPSDVINQTDLKTMKTLQSNNPLKYVGTEMLTQTGSSNPVHSGKVELSPESSSGDKGASLLEDTSDRQIDKSLHSEMLAALNVMKNFQGTRQEEKSELRKNLVEYLKYVSTSEHMDKTVTDEAKSIMKKLTSSDSSPIWETLQENIQQFSIKLEQALQPGSISSGKIPTNEGLHSPKKFSKLSSSENDNIIDENRSQLGSSPTKTSKDICESKFEDKLELESCAISGDIGNKEKEKGESKKNKIFRHQAKQILFQKAPSLNLEDAESFNNNPLMVSLETPSVSIVEALIDLSHSTQELTAGSNRLKELRMRRKAKKENLPPSKSRSELIDQLTSILDYVPDEEGVSFSTIFNALAKEESSILVDVLKLILGRVDKCHDDIEALLLLRDSVISVVLRNSEKKTSKVLRKIDENPYMIRTDHYLKRHIELCTALSYYKGLDSLCEILCESFKDPRSLKKVTENKTMAHLLMEVNTMIYLENSNPEFNSFFDRFVLDPNSPENADTMKFLLAEIDAITDLKSFEDQEQERLMSFKKALPDAIRSSKDIPSSVVEYLKDSPESAQKFIEEILGKTRRASETPSDSGYCSDSTGRHPMRGQATVILKGYIQAIIPRDMARAILAGRASYTLIDEEGITYFKASSAMSSKLTQCRWKNYGIFKECNAEDDKDLPRADSGVLSKPASGASSVSKQNSLDNEDKAIMSPSHDCPSQSLPWAAVPEVSGC